MFVALMFAHGAAALKPILLVPGIMATEFYANVTSKFRWYCPKQLTEKGIWLNEEYLIPPLYKCLFHWMTPRYDYEKNDYKDMDGVSIEVRDFGDTKSFEFMDTIKDFRLIGSWSKFVKHLQGMGYVKKQNMFGAPYDWRRGLAQPESFWNGVLGLIEKASELNGGEKVSIISHSLGAYAMQYFLTAKTTAEWRAKYIDTVIFISPSWGGSGWGFDALWEGRIPYGEILSDSAAVDCVRSLGALHIHVLNEEVFGDEVVSYGLDGENLTAAQLPEIIKANSKLNEEQNKLFELNLKYTRKAPQAVDVNAVIIYNSKLPTLKGTHTKTGHFIYGKGDGIVNVEGFNYACNNWKTGKAFMCHDFDTEDPRINHASMTTNEKVIKYASSLINDDSWKTK